MFLYYVNVHKDMTPQSMLTHEENEVYLELKEIGSIVETELTNKLESPFIDTIVATLDYFGTSLTRQKGVDQ